MFGPPFKALLQGEIMQVCQSVMSQSPNIRSVNFAKITKDRWTYLKMFKNEDSAVVMMPSLSLLFSK